MVERVGRLVLHKPLPGQTISLRMLKLNYIVVEF
jgi:hypothetical protein